MLLLLFAAAITGTVPSPEAKALGHRLAAKGALATMIPLLAEKDLAELAGEEPGLAPEQKARLLAIGRAKAKASLDRIVDTLGDAYASRLSMADLRLLVAQSETAASAHRRAAEPAAVAETMQALGEIDLKKTTAAAFCAESGKLCARK